MFLSLVLSAALSFYCLALWSCDDLWPLSSNQALLSTRFLVNFNLWLLLALMFVIQGCTCNVVTDMAMLLILVYLISSSVVSSFSICLYQGWFCDPWPFWCIYIWMMSYISWCHGFIPMFKFCEIFVVGC